MVNIVEIAPPAGGVTVEVLGREVEIFGVTGRQWAALARRYPELKRKLAGLEVAAEDMTLCGMESTPAIIAAGLGKPGDQEVEDAADRLPQTAQGALVRAIMELSFPPVPPGPTPAAAPTQKSTGSETAGSTTSP